MEVERAPCKTTPVYLSFMHFHADLNLGSVVLVLTSGGAVGAQRRFWEPIKSGESCSGPFPFRGSCFLYSKVAYGFYSERVRAWYLDPCCLCLGFQPRRALLGYSLKAFGPTTKLARVAFASSRLKALSVSVSSLGHEGSNDHRQGGLRRS